MKQAQEFLKQYLLAQKRVAALCSQIEILGNLAARATRASNTGGKAPDAMADAVAALADAKDLLRAQVEELEASRRRVQELIASLPDENHFREVLTLRYINGMKWDAVAASLNFDRRWVIRLHRRACEVVESRGELCSPLDTSLPARYPPPPRGE